jgi:imidazolonepropionase
VAGQAPPLAAGDTQRSAKPLLVLNIGQLVTLTEYKKPLGGRIGPLKTIPQAAVFAAEGRIVAAGPAAEICRGIPEGCQPDVIDIQGRCVVPGLVDCHSHLLYADDRTDEYPLRLAGLSGQEIAQRGGGLYRSVRAAREAGFRGLLMPLIRRLDAALASGTTTVEVKTGYGLETAAEEDQLLAIAAASKIHPADVVPTFFGAHGIPAEQRSDPARYVRQITDEMLPRVAPLARMCDVLCDAGAFAPPAAARILDVAKRHGLLLRLMADETSDAGAAALAAAHGAVAAAHLNYASEAGLAAMARAGVIAVILPATRFFHLTGRHPDVDRMRELEIPLALGSDHRPTSPLRSMITAMALACGELRLSPEEALLAATVNAAWAIGRGDRAGRIAAGYPADLVCLNVESYRGLPGYLDRQLVAMVIKRGVPVVNTEARG